MTKPSKPWERFERAVASFVAAVDPTALVRHNVMTPDHHTGRGRQRDVWVEGHFCGIPIAIHISCKHYRRKLDQSDIDVFVGELDSSRANVGVLFASSGFSDRAIEKAKACGIHCCRLYDDEIASLPPALTFEAYVCSAGRIELSFRPLPDSGESVTWGQVFSHPLRGGTTTVLDEIANEFQAAQQRAVEVVLQSSELPQPFAFKLELSTANGDPTATITVTGRWRKHRARVDAYLLNGAYTLTTGDYRGQFATPSIDIRSADPGPGWEEIFEDPPARGIRSVFIRTAGNVASFLSEHLASDLVC